MADKEANTDGKLENFEDVLEMVGTKGSWNIFVLVSCAAVGLMTPMQVLSAGFLGQTPPHWCHLEELVQANWTTEQIRAFATPQNQSCAALDYNYTAAASLGFTAAMADPPAVGGGGNNRSCAVRDFQPGVNSIVTEWDLVCDRLGIYSTTIAAAQAGLFVGSILFGYLLDRIGRRRGMLISTLLFVPSGLLVAASVDVYMYIACRMCVTAFGLGMYLGGFVLSMELCTPSQRSLVSSYYVLPWAVGYMLTAVIAYAVPPWRYMQVAFTLPSLVLSANYFIVPESPRWLTQRGRYEEARAELTKMGERNQRRLPPPEVLLETLRRVCPQSPSTGEPSSAAAWARKWVVPQLEWKTPLVFFCWFSVAMVYYGVSQGASNLGINEYLFIFVGGGLEIASYLLIWPGVSFLGRRVCVVATFVVAGVSLYGVMVMQIAEYGGDSPLLVFLSYLGKFMITAAFHLVYIITGELFSTSRRSLMIGESSVCARIGSISSPFINVLMGRGTKWAPSAFFGSFSLAAGLLCLALPETNNMALDGGGTPAPTAVQSTVHPALDETAGRTNQSFELSAADAQTHKSAA